MADLRPLILERDENLWQLGETQVTPETAQVDHIRPVRRFKRPTEANVSENLPTLCLPCHRKKTEADRRMASPVRLKSHAGFGRGGWKRPLIFGCTPSGLAAIRPLPRRGNAPCPYLTPGGGRTDSQQTGPRTATPSRR